LNGGGGFRSKVLLAISNHPRIREQYEDKRTRDKPIEPKATAWKVPGVVGFVGAAKLNSRGSFDAAQPIMA
jgi:hypothetical protein